MYGYIYISTNLITGCQYIGMKSSSVFVPDYFGTGKRVLAAIKEYGKENFSVELLEECTSKEELEQRERYWIRHFNAQEREDFYNIAEGGKFGSCQAGMTEEEWATYRTHLSESVKQSYNKNPQLRELRAETFRNISRRPRTPEERAESSRRFKQMWATRREEMLAIAKANGAKLVASGKSKEKWKTHTHPWIGRHHTDTTKRIISEKMKVISAGAGNAHAKTGTVLFNGEEVFRFDMCKDAIVYLKQQGVYRREYYRMAKGETIKGYSVVYNKK